MRRGAWETQHLWGEGGEGQRLDLRGERIFYFSSTAFLETPKRHDASGRRGVLCGATLVWMLGRRICVLYTLFRRDNVIPGQIKDNIRRTVELGAGFGAQGGGSDPVDAKADEMEGG